MAAVELVILDRDGVINEDAPAFVRSAQAWQPIPGSIEAIARLAQRGIAVAVATNQSGIARGLLDLTTLEAIHARMRAMVTAAGGRLDAVVFCPHGPDDGCTCRKPQPGLLQRIEAQLGVACAGAPFVGDSLRDLQAGRAAGCRPVLVRTGNGRRTETEGVDADVAVFDDLAAFVDDLIGGGE
ncbi:MAG TPA: D-glycero-beta-D-manno-heptose 1,7-bisphosphate 7-phosphatase [Pseudomonadales bacterium]|nr:D-glycero-beta-D-manno-heptose 1,7-bisphosphate 7-phosphatase [Pseudomonadales bacterium]